MPNGSNVVKFWRSRCKVLSFGQMCWQVCQNELTYPCVRIPECSMFNEKDQTQWRKKTSSQHYQHEKGKASCSASCDEWSRLCNRRFLRLTSLRKVRRWISRKRAANETILANKCLRSRSRWQMIVISSSSCSSAAETGNVVDLRLNFIFLLAMHELLSIFW